MCASREYVCYIGPLKDCIWNAGSQKCCKITWKIRGWMEEMLQIACKYEAGHQKCCKLHAKRRGWGIIWGTIPWGGGSRTPTGTIYIYIHVYIYIYTWTIIIIHWSSQSFKRFPSAISRPACRPIFDARMAVVPWAMKADPMRAARGQSGGQMIYVLCI